MPVRLTRSSTDAKRRCAGPAPCSPRQSCEQVLQKNIPGLTSSSMLGSSQPHLGQRSGSERFGSERFGSGFGIRDSGLDLTACPTESLLANPDLSIAFPISSLSLF